MADDDVQLTDLEVIQRYSLAVRGASAPRAELVAALQADLDWLSGRRGRSSAGSKSATASTGAGKPAAKRAPAKRTPAKRAAAAKD